MIAKQDDELAKHDGRTSQPQLGVELPEIVPPKLPPLHVVANRAGIAERGNDKFAIGPRGRGGMACHGRSDLRRDV